jgi:hypothetical protein
MKSGHFKTEGAPSSAALPPIESLLGADPVILRRTVLSIGHSFSFRMFGVVSVVTVGSLRTSTRNPGDSLFGFELLECRCCHYLPVAAVVPGSPRVRLTRSPVPVESLKY